MVRIKVQERAPLNKTRLEYFLGCIGTAIINNGMTTNTLECLVERDRSNRGEEESRNITVCITVAEDSRRSQKDLLGILSKALAPFCDGFEAKLEQTLLVFVAKQI